MATSPEDASNSSVVAWLDRLQHSVKTSGGTAGDAAFTSPRDNPNNERDCDSEDAPLPDEGDGDEGEWGEEGAGPDKLQSLPDDAVPLGLIANLALSNSKSKHGHGHGHGGKDADLATTEAGDDNDIGVANDTYFMPGQCDYYSQRMVLIHLFILGPATNLDIRAMMIEQHSPPEILVHGLVSPKDIEKLFDM